MKQKLTKQKLMDASTYIVVTAAFLILQLLMSQGKLSSTMKGFLVPACAYVVLAVSLNLLVGICGELSLGHAGFMGIGAFSGVVQRHCWPMPFPTEPCGCWLPWWLAVRWPGSWAFSSVFPCCGCGVTTWPLVTLAFGEIMKNIIGNLYLGVDDKGLHATLRNEGLTLLDGGKMIISGPRKPPELPGFPPLPWALL